MKFVKMEIPIFFSGYFLKSFLVFLIFLTFFGFNRALPLQGPAYLEFTVNATEFPTKEYYDYIIVGGGTSGCPLATTLSQNFRVLLLERGGVPFGNPNLMTQEGFLTTLLQADTNDSPAQPFISEEGVPNTRGQVLGGSSAINAGFYSRADQEFYSKSGINWDLKMVNLSYEWVEDAIVFRPELRSWQSAVRDGLLEAGVHPYNHFNLEHVLGTKIGGSTFDPFGRRHSAADLLNFAIPQNIKVGLNAYVQRIIFSPSKNSELKAKGVVYRDLLGRYHRALVRGSGEVILSAGAIGSPQLLLLSGIGSKPYLSSWGIPVSYHSPYVGQFLYDNPRNGISILPPMPLDHSLIQVVGITEGGFYLEAASNVIPIVPSLTRSQSSPLYITVATIMEKISGPVSTGFLRLGSIDVRVNPIVRFNYFSDPKDLEACVIGMRKIGEILKSSSMEYFKVAMPGGRDFRFLGPALPVDQSDDVMMGEFCRRTISTIWHYHGGSVVGKVVDSDLKVMGIKGLRVIDGSILKLSPGTNPQATLLMLGRYMGLKLIRERMR